MIAAVIFRQDDGTTRRDAELIAMERRACGGGAVVEEVVGIQLVVAQKLPRRAVEFVGAGFDRRIDLAAGLASELGRIVRALHAEFVQGVDDGLDGIGAVLHFLRHEAVDQKSVALWRWPLTLNAMPPARSA